MSKRGERSKDQNQAGGVRARGPAIQPKNGIQRDETRRRKLGPERGIYRVYQFSNGTYTQCREPNEPETVRSERASLETPWRLALHRGGWALPLRSRGPKRTVGRESTRGARAWLTRTRREAAGPRRPEARGWGAAKARPARRALWGEATGPWGTTWELPWRWATLRREALWAGRPSHAAGHGSGVWAGMRTRSRRSAHRWRALSLRGDSVGTHGLAGHA